MTLPTTTRVSATFVGNSVATVFAFSYKVFARTDVAVQFTSSSGVVSTLVLDSDYSVSLNADQTVSPGGTITYPLVGSAMASPAKLVIYGNLPFDQTLALPGGGNFSPVALERALDRIDMQVQQVNDKTALAVRAPLGEALPALPAAAQRANNALVFDASGNPSVAPYLGGSLGTFLPLVGGTMTGPILGAAGSAALPGYSFAGDTNTGLFSPAADMVGISANGAERFRVDSSGAETVLGTVALPSYSFLGDTNTGMWSPAADTIAWSTNGSERVRVISTGEVGIGRTPGTGTVLDLTGPSNVTPRVSAASGASALWTFNHNSGDRCYIGVAGASDAIVNGTVANDMFLRANGSAILLSADSGTTATAVVTAANDLQVRVNTAAPSLTVNQRMVFTLTSNTNLRISVRGTDGTTRTTNLTLA